VIDRSALWIAQAVSGRLEAGRPDQPGPKRAVCDSRAVGAGELFVGIAGENVDGGYFGAQALELGAWGVLVSEVHAKPLAEMLDQTQSPGVVISVSDPTTALGDLARAWRRELACPCVGITGSTGKTSTKDILSALLAPHRRAHSSRENLNTEIGLPLAILEAESQTEVLVLEMAMRGEGEIGELTSIAEPQVGLIVNIGPVHLERLGSVERVAAAKAELITGLAPGGACVIPADSGLLEPYLRSDVDTITFGRGGDVTLSSFDQGKAIIDARGHSIELNLSYSQPHNLSNTLAAVAGAMAIGVDPTGDVDVGFSAMRGQVLELGTGATVINDCYNANPMSMDAALEHLASSPATRRIAVLGEMAELGTESERFHLKIGQHVQDLGIDVLICVGSGASLYTERFRGETHTVATPEQASAVLSNLSKPGDRILIKGSRSAGLERVLG
jgi:UDP-N-acetylmuramoyl-tripeptide--D-alanyl-D-alanine ligase